MSAHVVFVHGMWSTPGVWDKWRGQFERAGFSTEAFALPGHSGDEADHALHGLGLADYCEAVLQRVTNLSEPPVVVGHSLGGLIAQQVATRARLAAAILVCSAAPAPIFPQRLSMLPSLARHFHPFGSWRGAFRLSRREADCLIFNVVPPTDRQRLYETLIAESGRVAWEAAYGTLNWTGSNRVEQTTLTCPMLALAGGRDHIIPAGVSRRMARWYGEKMDYREYAAHGHWMLSSEAGWNLRAKEACTWLSESL
ncbi:pimeloyl-ACP methyl ester carboxylesterase [Paraburkholderia sp. GAS41]|jgi:pimeloyl-ACP methyl ester carboxylesterase|uniref:alpha/beta hydrolase n=1 Tax=Paraburkholderia sp. GAS41 TaxID=3035134 RepID=UPI003D263CE6